MRKWLAPAKVNRLAADPARQTQAVDIGEIDFSKPFLPEDYTQLYYTPLYRALSDDQRLRYNQLFGIRTNEYIMMLEAELVERLLRPLRRHPRVAGDAELVRAIDTMVEEERRHYRYFVELNRACLPEIFVEGRERYFSELPWQARATFGLIGAIARQLAFPLWYLMAMEEASMTLARDMIRTPETETLGPLEPTFLAVHREHMKDEARHLQVDGLLIETCLMKDGGLRRRTNAKLFTSMLGGITRPERSGSGVKVIRRLVRERPELQPREEALIQAVLALRDNAGYQKSLFNRRSMPLTFGLFDASPELDGLENAMVGYDRR